MDSSTGISGKKIILFLPCLPYPLRANGISVRYLPVIEHLSKTNVLDLVLFRQKPEKREGLDALRNFCRNVSCVQNPKYISHGILSKLKTCGGFAAPWSPPYSLVTHGADLVEKVIEEHAGRDEYDALLWVGAQFLPHLISVMPLRSVKRHIVDFIDSPSLMKERATGGTGQNGVFGRYELWKTRRWEGEVARRMDETVYISDVDAQAVPCRRGSGNRKRVVPNGVEFDSYTAGKAKEVASPSIGFLGNMGYGPNIEAVHWLFEKVYLPARKEIPGLSLVVIGKNPVESVRAIGSEPGVLVTGSVEDIWPYVNAVDLFVFPLQRGAGLKNKILETMMARRPVITTPIGNEGIDAVAGRDISIAGTPEEFRKETVRLLASNGHRTAMGEAAHRFVSDRFSWERILLLFEEVVAG